MDLMKKYGADAAKKSIRQYCPPRCYELMGRAFRSPEEVDEHFFTDPIPYLT